MPTPPKPDKIVCRICDVWFAPKNIQEKDDLGRPLCNDCFRAYNLGKEHATLDWIKEKFFNGT